MIRAGILVGMMLAVLPLRAAESGDEQALRAAGVKSDGPALLAFFRTRTLKAEDVRKIEVLVRQLGSRSFARREQASRALIKRSWPAVPLLRVARNSADLEIARRASRCLDAIEQGPGPELAASAARVLARLAPDGAVAVLLAYLPHVDDESVEEAVHAALLSLSPPTKPPHADLTAALRDAAPGRRGAAAHVLGRQTDAARRAAVYPLLTDRDAYVRFLAARALLFGRDRKAVPALIAHLSAASVSRAWQVEELLFRLAGDKAPSLSLGDASPAARHKARTAWQAWWEKHAARVDFARLDIGRGLLGLTLGIEYNTNRVWECAPNGRLRWQITNLMGPMEAWVLPGNRVLIGDGRGVTERDFKGKILWTLKGVGGVTGCQRLPGGNTFVSTYSTVLEFNRDGRKLYEHRIPGSNAIRKHRNGNILYTTSNALVEMNTAGKTVRRVPLPQQGGWIGLEDLPGDRFLLASSGRGRIVEINAAGKVLWEGTVGGACGVARLPNGHVLVGTAGRVVELNRGGKVVWEKKSPGYVRRVHRR